MRVVIRGRVVEPGLRLQSLADFGLDTRRQAPSFQPAAHNARRRDLLKSGLEEPHRIEDVTALAVINSEGATSCPNLARQACRGGHRGLGCMLFGADKHLGRHLPLLDALGAVDDPLVARLVPSRRVDGETLGGELVGTQAHDVTAGIVQQQHGLGALGSG